MQYIHFNRFGQVLDKTSLQPAVDIGGHGIGGEGDYRNIAGYGVSFKRFQHLIAIHAG